MSRIVIANDLLLAAKMGIRNYSVAITQVATPEIRYTRAKHLEDSITFHKKLRITWSNKVSIIHTILISCLKWI